MTGRSRWRRSPWILGSVVLATTGAALGILGRTLTTLDGISRQFAHVQLKADGVANAQRELLHIESDLARLYAGGDVKAVELHRGLFLQQMSAVEATLTGERLARAKAVDDAIRSVDWSPLALLPPPGPARDEVLVPLDRQLQAIERDYKQFYDAQVRGFYASAGQAVAAKTRSQRLVGVLIILLVALAIAWVLAIRRRSRSDLAEAYDSLRLSEERFRSLVQHSSDLTLVCGAGGSLQYVSPASIDLLGISDADLAGSAVGDLLHTDDPAAPVLDAWTDDTGRGARTFEGRLRHVDGTYRRVEATATNLLDDAAVGGIVLNIRDVTDRKRLEAELRHAQKLESVGQLAAGIAHEINTPIQFVGDNVRFLRGAFDDLSRMATTPLGGATPDQVERLAQEIDLAYLAEEVPEAIDQTLAGIDRVATIVRAMKAFGHPSSEHKERADLNEAVRNTLVVATNETKYVADVTTELGELPPVPCHLGDVNQVLLNLVVNAAHAVSAKVGDSGGRGTITVRTFTAGTDAVIEVADTGTGIPAEIAERVFEPFFTTKGVGVGTGQGLALAYSLVHDRHGGSITFRSEPGEGTTFSVRLPLATNQSPDPTGTEVLV